MLTLSPIPLGCQKDIFSIPPEVVYLNSAFMGPLARPVHEAGVRALGQRAAPVTSQAADFFEPAERTRQLCAQLVNANPERVAFIPSAAAGMAVVANNLAPARGQNVVVLGDQFPSNVYPWRRWQADGVTVRTVAAPMANPSNQAAWRQRAQQWNEQLLAAIDNNTALVAVEQAHWTDGTLFDLALIGERARAVGAAWVIDATQTVGAMPLDVSQLQPDALVVHSYKSMLSNYGLGFAVYGERFANGRPNEESWLMRQGSEDFSRLVDYQDNYAHGMRRFDTSTRCNPMMIGMLEASCHLLLQWQPARVRAYLLATAAPALRRLRESGFGVADDDIRAANLFGITLPTSLQPEAVRSELASKKILVSVRGGAVRVSPHVYNDGADLHQLADALLVFLPG